MKTTTQPSPDERPDLYECASCSARSGAPTLCAQCLAARHAAGERWIGPRSSTRQDVKAAREEELQREAEHQRDMLVMYDQRLLLRHARGESGTSFDGECFRLAEHFLDQTDRDTKDDRTLLAITIQRAIEGWLEEHEVKDLDEDER